MKSKVFLPAGFLLLLLLIPGAYGEVGTPVQQCQNAFPNLVTDIPWKAMFPIRIGGKKVISVGGMPDNIDTPNEWNLGRP